VGQSLAHTKPRLAQQTLPVQHCALFWQTAPCSPHTQAAFSQRSLQQSPFPSQPSSPVAIQGGRQLPLMHELPVQQSLSFWQAPSRATQAQTSRQTGPPVTVAQQTPVQH